MKKRLLTVGLMTMLLLGACSEEQAAVSDEPVDPQATANLEQSLLGVTTRISEQTVASHEDKSVSELEQLSESDRAALRSIAELDLMESAELEAEEQSKKESDYRVQ